MGNHEIETDEEYVKRLLKRKAKALVKASGMKYTEALRYVKETEAAEQDISSKTWPQIEAEIKAFVKFTEG